MSTDQARFTEASAFVLQFGKYAGDTLSQIGQTESGLRYLDWLIGRQWLKDPAKTMIKTYLAHPDVSRLVDAAIDDDD
jgi:hypothetical protein